MSPDFPPADRACSYRLGIGTFDILLTYLAENGLDRVHCLQAAGVTPDVLDDPEADIDARQELSLMGLLVRELGDGFRHGLNVGKRQGLTAHGVWGLGVMSSSNGFLAAQWGGRFASVAFPFIRYRWRLARCGPLLLMDARHLPQELRAFVIARDLATFWSLHQDLLPGLPMPARELRLTLRETEGMDSLRELYGCVVRTGQPRTGMALDPAILQHAFPGANRITQAQCERYCRELISRRKQRLNLSDRVRDFLRTRGDNLPTLGEVAESFHQSPRSLRRQLTLEGTGWRQLRDEVLERQARRLLRSGQFTVEQVAEQLGYTEPSSFSHAFKRWTGLSPVQFRQAHGLSTPGKEKHGFQLPVDHADILRGMIKSDIT